MSVCLEHHIEEFVRTCRGCVCCNKHSVVQSFFVLGLRRASSPSAGSDGGSETWLGEGGRLVNVCFARRPIAEVECRTPLRRRHHRVQIGCPGPGSGLVWDRTWPASGSGTGPKASGCTSSNPKNLGTQGRSLPRLAVNQGSHVPVAHACTRLLHTHDRIAARALDSRSACAAQVVPNQPRKLGPGAWCAPCP
jgi:hypothetical protein